MRHRSTVFATVTALALSGGAWAQSSDRPYYIGLTQDFTHQSNVLSAVDGSEQSSTVSTTTLRGGLNVPFGRQRAYASASVVHTGYSDVSSLANTGYALSAGLDWSTIEKISGNLVVSANQRQADLNTGIATAVLRNDEKVNAVSAQFRLGGDSLLGFDANIGHRDVSYTAPEFASQQYKLDNGSLGLTYRPGGALTLGTGLSIERTRYKEAAAGQTAPDSSKRRDVYGTATWVPTGASTLRARVNVGKSEYDLATGSNYSGVTGYLTWDWRPSGFLSFNTTATRDSGQNTGFLQLTSGTPVRASDFSQLNNTISLGATYALTAKVSITGNVSSSRRDLVDGFTGSTGKDTTNTVGLAARWQALRNASLSCSVGREDRSASGTGSTDYKNNRIGCVGELLID